jgi:hypothetical protein
MCLKRNEVERLDKEQTRVNEAAFDQNWLVYGPAGTGKTILALNRLKRLSQLRKGEVHAYISKSKMLGRWVQQAAEEMGVGELILTYDSYVWHWLQEYLEGTPPTLKHEWGIDWDLTLPLLRSAAKNTPDIKKRSIVIDEAQDIELGFFEACKLICSRIFVLMDENQKTPVWANSKRTQIARTLGLDSDHQCFLGVNYRNPLEIKDLSETFYSGNTDELATLPPASLRRKLETKPSIRWLPYDGKNSQISRVLDYCAARPKATVCVVASSNNEVTLQRDLDKYSKEVGKLKDLNDWSVRAYVPRKYEPCTTDFCLPGIVVAKPINLKGSEYDAVYLLSWGDCQESQPSMYTLISRARARIEVLADPTAETKNKVRSLFERALAEELITEANE